LHGLIHQELQRYVAERYGQDAWRRLLEGAGLERKSYLVSEQYPDEELVSLVTEASKMTGTAAPVLLQDYGKFIVPTLVKTYGSFIKSAWRTLDLIEHTEAVIHRAVRMRDPLAAPPELHAERRRPNEVVITYTSPRKLCAVAKGIVEGVADHYGESVTIREPSCMLRGDSACEIAVTLQG
jgi:predicted hydrocarbon binding protein